MKKIVTERETGARSPTTSADSYEINLLHIQKFPRFHCRSKFFSDEDVYLSLSPFGSFFVNVEQ